MVAAKKAERELSPSSGPPEDKNTGFGADGAQQAQTSVSPPPSPARLVRVRAAATPVPIPTQEPLFIALDDRIAGLRPPENPDLVKRVAGKARMWFGGGSELHKAGSSKRNTDFLQSDYDYRVCTLHPITKGARTDFVKAIAEMKDVAAVRTKEPAVHVETMGGATYDFVPIKRKFGDPQDLSKMLLLGRPREEVDDDLDAFFENNKRAQAVVRILKAQTCHLGKMPGVFFEVATMRAAQVMCAGIEELSSVALHQAPSPLEISRKLPCRSSSEWQRHLKKLDGAAFALHQMAIRLLVDGLDTDPVLKLLKEVRQEHDKAPALAKLQKVQSFFSPDKLQFRTAIEANATNGLSPPPSGEATLASKVVAPGAPEQKEQTGGDGGKRKTRLTKSQRLATLVDNIKSAVTLSPDEQTMLGFVAAMLAVLVALVWAFLNDLI
eukprot:g398.t1